MDADGTFSYSPVRTVALTGAAASPSLYPNPAHGAATLTGALPAGLPAGVYVVRAGPQAVRLAVE